MTAARFRLAAFAAAALIALPPGANASSVDIDFTQGIYYEGSSRKYETVCEGDSYCFDASGFIFRTGYYEVMAGIEVEDETSPFTHVYRESGGLFDVHSLTIGLSVLDAPYVTGSTPPPAHDAYDRPDSYEPDAYSLWALSGGIYTGLRYGIYGIKDGTVTGAYEFSSIDTGDWVCDWTAGPGCIGEHPYELTLGPGFTGIDALKLDLLLDIDDIFYTEWEDEDLGPGDLWCEGDWCTGFSVTAMNATLYPEAPAPVPLPPAMPLMASGLAALAVLVRRRRA